MAKKAKSEQSGVKHIAEQINGEYVKNYRAAMEAMMHQHASVESERESDIRMKRLLLPPITPQQESISASKKNIVDSVTVRGATAKDAMPQLRKIVADAFAAAIDECERLRANHKTATGQHVQDVNLSLINLIREVDVISLANETEEEIEALIEETLAAAVNDFRTLTQEPSDNTFTPAPAQTYGVTPTPKKAPSIKIGLPALHTPESKAVADHTDTPAARIKAYLQKAGEQASPQQNSNPTQNQAFISRQINGEYCYANPVRFIDPTCEQAPNELIDTQTPPAQDHTTHTQPIIQKGSLQLLPAPGWLKTDDINYYKNRAADFTKRTGKQAPSYYMGYGDVYAHKFKERTKPTLSTEGQKWVDNAFKNLQEAIEVEIHEHRSIEFYDKEFTDFAFNTHVHAYERAGVLSLSMMDKIKILLTPKAEDLFSDRGLKQAAQIGTDQAELYLLHPGFGMSQAKELADNSDKVVNLVHNYYIENKKFFDNAAKMDPQGWSDPEHKIMGLLKNIFGGLNFY